MVLCQPTLSTGTARVRVDTEGVILDRPTNVLPDYDSSIVSLSKYTTNSILNLLGQSNAFVFYTQKPTWHNDSFATEYIHYFINRERGDLRLTKPLSPLPTSNEIEEAINKAYARLFAFG